MTGALLSFSVTAISIRGLAGALSVMEILAVRASLGLVILLIIVAWRPGLRLTIGRRNMGLQIARNVVHFGAQYLWSLSVIILPLATVFALEFTMPLWTIVLAAPLLGERLTVSRVGAVILGLLGVLVILQPGTEAFRAEALIVLAAALGYALSIIATKKLTRTETTFAIMVWMNLIQLPLALLGSDPLFATKLSIEHLPAVLGIGGAGLFAHYCLTNAFRAGDASLVIPLDFFRLPLIAVVGWLLYAERLDLLLFIGAGLIFIGIFWSLHAETRRPLRASAAPPAAGGNTGPSRAERVE
jgi:drug/metabolite transporter (DMT)-like permease